jgi:hypothetical protein
VASQNTSVVFVEAGGYPQLSNLKGETRTSFQFSHGSDFLCQISFHSLFLLDVRTTLPTNCAVRDDIKRAIADRAVQARKYRVDYGIDW